MNIASLRGSGHGDVRQDDPALRAATSPTRLALHQLGTHTDGVELQSRGAGLTAAGHTINTGTTTNAHDTTGTATSLMDTASSELSGAHSALSDSLQGESLSSSSLNSMSGPSTPKGLTANSDGSITTPGGYTIYNDGGWQWRIKDPSGIETRIWGDPHVDEGNDGKSEWDFQQDSSFILGDGTKIFCDVSPYNGGPAMVTDALTIQSGDQLGTMNVKDGGAGQVVDHGGRDYDSQHADGKLFVMGKDYKFYDGDTLKSESDPTRTGQFGNDALGALHAAHFEAGVDDGWNGGVQKLQNNERLATLVNLENNAFLVDDSTGKATEAAKNHGKLGKENILGQANQAANGMPSLAKFDANGDGKLSGAELNGVKVWIDKNNDGNVDDGELKLLAELNINELQVKMAVQHQEDGTTRLDAHLTQNGNTITTNDRINPLRDGAQANNFQRQLLNAVGGDPAQRALARDRIDAANQALQQARNQQVEGGRLAAQAGQRLATANLGGTRA